MQLYIFVVSFKIGFSLFLGFMDYKENVKQHQLYPLVYRYESFSFHSVSLFKDCELYL